MTATQAQIFEGEFSEVCLIAYCFLNPDPNWPYRWKEWRDPDNYRWFLKNIYDPNGPIPPYTIPVLCGSITTAAGVTGEYASDEAAIRASVEALVAPYREAA